jgi:predicted short-subunit dehydrogenase-like oxidoreductase (DUF2520 family)
MLKSLAIVGAGRVGRALGKRLREEGWRLGAVVARSAGSAARAVRFIGAGHAQAGISARILLAHVILVATPDDQIAAVVRDMVALLDEAATSELRGHVILHTSGALDSHVLHPLRCFGAAVGSLHPLQTFSGVRIPPLQGKCFAIEGDDLALRTARALVRSLGGRAIKIGAEKKILYHAAAALAAGHVLAIEEAASRMLMSAGMSRRQAARSLVSLSRQVLDNFERLGGRAAWTGPLARGDYRVVLAHGQAMSGLPVEYARAYEALNRLGARVLASNTKSTLARLDKLVVAQ